MTEIDALLILNHLRVGPITSRKLMDAFGSAIAIFTASERQISAVSHLSSANVAKIKQWEKHVKLDKAWSDIKENDIKIVTYKDEIYPPMLREIYDHPLLFYLKGEIKPQDNQAVAFVGTRNATGYGRSIARKWAYNLASRGFTIVSGLARGIDTESHIGAIEANGRTIAVLGFGLGYVYPKENAALLDKIAETGAVITEYPWKKYHGKASFPLRNRLIAGLSRATLVVESRRRGGSLITAHFANEYNRTVFAVPGSINFSASSGANQLIRDGATLVTTPDEITEEFEFLFPMPSGKDKKTSPVIPNLEGNEKILYELITEPISIDQLSEKSDISIEKVTTALLMLELKGLIRMLPGKIYDRK